MDSESGADRRDKESIDIGSALLSAPFGSFRVDAEEPKDLGIFQRLKTLMENRVPASPTVAPPANPAVEHQDNGREQRESDNDDVSEHDLDTAHQKQTEDGINDRIVDYVDDDDEDAGRDDFNGEFISFSDEEEGGAITSAANPGSHSRKSAASIPERDEWRRNLSHRQIRDRFEQMINQLTIVKQKPAWFDSRKRLPVQAPGYRGESLPRIFHEEILDFVHYLSPTAEEHRIRQYIVNRIQQVVCSIWPDASLHVFGSFNTRLYLPSSDIDLVVLTPSTLQLSSRSVLHKLASKLRSSGLVFEKSLDVIPARVPIIKFTDSIGQFSIDISHGIENGIQAANRMSELSREYPAIRPLAMIMKQFLLMRGLNEVFSGGLGSYGLTLLITSFLQMHPRIQSGSIKQEDNLGVLLIQMLELYGKRFNYDTVGISTRDQEYFRKGQSGRLSTAPHEGQRAVVEDPDDKTNNITRGTFNLRLVKAAFSRASDILIGTFYELNQLRESFRPRHRFTVKSILATIIQVPESVVAHREFIHRIYLDNKSAVESDRWPLDQKAGEDAKYFGTHKRRRPVDSDDADDDDDDNGNVSNADGESCEDEPLVSRRNRSSSSTTASSGSSNSGTATVNSNRKKKRKIKPKRRRKFQTF